jgi:uncharacterized RDD family membrane protein YckC
MKKNKRKIETSKILLIVSDVMAAAVLIGTVVAVFVLQDATPLAYLIPAVFGLAATSHGFYYWKAKAENLNKWGQGDKVTMKEEEDPTKWTG